MNFRKTISVVVPVYNEITNLDELYQRTTAVMRSLENYSYEIVFFDDGSTDGSREKIEELCRNDSNVKAVFFSRNYGYSNCVFYAVQQAKGDCAVLLHADMQNPPELIPELVNRWENGAKNVLGVKNKSKENPVMYFLRTLVYWIFNHVFAMNLIPHATEFELLDKSFIEVLNKRTFRNPFLRGIILENAEGIELFYYTQDRRNSGKSHFSVGKYYDFAICGVVNMSKKLPRRILVFGLICMLISVLEFIFGFIPNAVKKEIADVMTALIVRFGFFAVSVLISFSAIVGEYIVAMKYSLDEKEVVTEERRIDY